MLVDLCAISRWLAAGRPSLVDSDGILKPGVRSSCLQTYLPQDAHLALATRWLPCSTSWSLSALRSLCRPWARVPFPKLLQDERGVRSFYREQFRDSMPECILPQALQNAMDTHKQAGKSQRGLKHLVGGGIHSLPIMQRVFCEKTSW